MLGIHENVCYMMTLRNAASNEVQIDIPLHHETRETCKIIDTRMTCEFEPKP